MPRDVLILTKEAPRPEELVHAGVAIDGGLGMRTLDDEAVTEIIDEDGLAVLSVGRPELVEVQDEVLRLAPGLADRISAPVWWTEAWVPWGAAGDRGMAIALQFAARLDGLCSVEDGS
ncbi:hypothetical protein [Curtobacterium sp. Leaf261]|uniref:hypothetical protein n=1 Tax=Curtobacterium sp. Leaf261 TaxID=1736311 RepID=UPI0006F66C93|nr:hypothetical protein [Curtobacterium sp. Leaf261]KQO62222.1 hypothetical protein ASF23_10400 [Curtobacterium sp. Leaf261]